MIEKGFVSKVEYIKHLDGDWRLVHNLWRHIRNYMTTYPAPAATTYTKTEIDAFFEGYSGGKAQVDAGNVVGLTQGSIPFADASGFLTEDNSNLFWDAANLRLGIDQAAPTARIDIVAAGSEPGINISAAANGEISTPDGEQFRWGHWNSGTTTFTERLKFDASGIFYVSYLTAGSVIFAGAGGEIKQDNADFHWNTAAKLLTVGEITITNGHGLNLQEDISFTGANGVNLILFPDNLAAALQFREGVNAYINFRTTNGSEGISIYKTLALTFVGASGSNLISMPDNLAIALDFREAANSYLKFVTTNGSEAVVFGKVFTGITGSTIGNLTLADGSIRQASGAITFQTNEATNTDTIISIKGKGSGKGNLYLYDQDDAEYLRLYCYSGRGYIKTAGTAPQPLYIMDNVAQNILCWSSLTAGNPYLYLYGWDTVAGAVKYGKLGVNSAGHFEIRAEELMTFHASGVGIGYMSSGGFYFEDDIKIFFGTNIDMCMGYMDTGDIWHLCDQATLGSNIRMSINATGLSFFGVTPVAQVGHIGDTGGDDATVVNAILVVLENLGFIADA